MVYFDVFCPSVFCFVILFYFIFLREEGHEVVWIGRWRRTWEALEEEKEYEQNRFCLKKLSKSKLIEKSKGII